MPDNVVRLGSPGELVQAVPQLLGYLPTDSIVMLCLKGSRLRLELTLRYDLELADIAPVDLVEEMAARARLVTSRQVFVIVYGSEAPETVADLPYRDVADLMEAKWRFPLREMVYTARGRWWSYRCDDQRCCPAEGTALDPSTPAIGRLAAERAGGGVAMLPDRAAIVRSVALDDDGDLEDRQDQVAAALLAAGGMEIGLRRRRTRELTHQLVARLSDPRSTVRDDEAFELAGLVWHVLARDEVLVLGGDDDRRTILLRILRQVVRRVPPPFDAPVCTLLSWFAYADGDGTMANVALTRALDTDPDYSLAGLIAGALERQVPPSCLHEVMARGAEDLNGRSAAG